MHKILYRLAMIQISSGLCLLQLLARKAHSDAMNVENTMRGVLANPVGIFQTTQPPSDQLQQRLVARPPIEDIKKLMTLLTLQSAITQQTRRSGLKPLAIFKNESDRSVN